MSKIGRIAVLALLLSAGALFLRAEPAKADVLYSNGPVNGTISAISISALDGSQVEDSFTLSSASILTGVSFGDWLPMGTISAQSVDWAIVASEGSQTPICPACSGTGSLTAGASFGGVSMFTIVDQSFSLPDLALGPGTYWLELLNLKETPQSGSFWDINGGPSLVWSSVFGDLNGENCQLHAGLAAGACSNSFDILGTAVETVPEPGSLAILAAALLGLLGVVRATRSKIGRIASVAAMSLLAASLFSRGAQGIFTVDITQVGADVVATGSGSLDLTGLTFEASGVLVPDIRPALATIILGSGTSDVYTGGISGPATFGDGVDFNPDVAAGDPLAIDGATAELGVPHNYVSGTALSDSDTFDGATFASLGLTPGTYTYSWGPADAPTDTVIVTIGSASPVPEPSTFAVLAAGLLGLGLLRRRKTRDAPLPAG